MKKLLIPFIFLFSLVCFLYADESDKELYQQAMDYYNGENYYGAIKNYKILLSNGVVNSSIYYNLALSYFKISEYGQCSLNTERALRLSPRDKDIRTLKKALAKKIKDPQENIAEKIIMQLKLLASLNELTIILFLIFVAIGAFVSLYCIYYKNLYLKIAIVLSILFIMIFPLLYVKVGDEILSKEAVIMSSTYVRNNPIKNEDPSFEITAGRKVVILSELGRWKNIKSSIDGLSGWVDKSALELI